MEPVARKGRTLYTKSLIRRYSGRGSFAIALRTKAHPVADSPTVLSPTRYALRSTGLKTKAGVIRVETRVAIAVRFCAGASYLDLQDIHGVS